MILMLLCGAPIGMSPINVLYGVGRFCKESDERSTGRFRKFFSGKFCVS